MKRKILFLFLAFIGLTFAVSLIYYFHFKADGEIRELAVYRYQSRQTANFLSDIETLQKRVDNPSPQAGDWGTLAGLFYAQGKISGNTTWFDQAEEAARKSLKLQPQPNAGARLILAKVKASRHEFREAIEIATEAFQNDSSKTSALAVIITSYLAMGDLTQAGSFADQFINRSPGLESYALRALIMEATGRVSESTNDFKRALELEDFGAEQESAWARCLFARSLIRNGDYANARILLNSALKIKSDYHLAYDLLGDLFLREGDYANSEKYLKAAFASSKQLAYLVHLAKLKTIMNEAQAALQIQTQAEILIRMELDKNGFGHRLDLVSLLLDRGQPNDAKEALQLAEEESKVRRSPVALSVLSRAQLANGEIQKSYKTLREVLQTGIRDSEYYSQMAVLERDLENRRQAQFYMKEAVALEPQNQQLQKINQTFLN